MMDLSERFELGAPLAPLPGRGENARALDRTPTTRGPSKGTLEGKECSVAQLHA